ncbi:tRNA adenosine(34) deaminase TadA [Candidatus Schneideria nysicola]|uniref:tRNA adenosine(34) deaminase TadA n=1 Tax=Candidatus Schneideria nysicola TaxID=1081631 RepID=UPI001CAA6CB5|nr:tRNA adenosine(34) deaminase TadA [Candidatus Schneideria nysicola]UAJ65340.1 tRNA adenosine(34) deaminase TadA [Candidatus Schneideria nysicola]
MNINNQKDKHWMSKALQLANNAKINGEVPVGAVLVLKNNIIGEGWNCSITHCDPTAHAEIVALRQGSKNIKNYRLLDSVMYVTIEPCIMCAGAMIHARIKRLVFANYSKKTGAVGSFINILRYPGINHLIILNRPLMSERASLQLKNFFKERRIQQKNNKINRR